jgi:hypothetical protein
VLVAVMSYSQFRAIAFGIAILVISRKKTICFGFLNLILISSAKCQEIASPDPHHTAKPSLLFTKPFQLGN